MSNKINESYLNVEEINQTTGEVITLSSTSETSVQTVPLMRLGVFVPTLKSTNKAIAKKAMSDQTSTRQTILGIWS